MPGPDKGSWCNNSAACSLEATFNPRYPCSCSNGWPEENKTCQHYFPLNKYVPPEEAFLKKSSSFTSCASVV